MTYTFFTTSDSEEEEDTKYSSFVELEDFEEDEEPQAFDGTEKGSNIQEEETEGPVPWDPAESFFAYL